MTIDRRSLLAAAAGSTLLASTRLLAKKPEHKEEKEAEEVSPLEDLMREHGLLNRVLLVYDECVRRVEGKMELPRDVVASSAGIIQKFVEGYHEKLEEEHLFPRLEKAGKLVELVQVLKAQHLAGRKVTAEILKNAGAADENGRKRLSAGLRAFVRMYRPHEAREDTVLFPAFHEVVKGKEYDKLGEAFEEREHELFGEDGFEKMVAEVARIEGTLGIGDLAGFTPKV